jgi:two-component system, chemotaxis family, sensor kinase Cph1
MTAFTDNDNVSWKGEPYSIKRHGTSLATCDSEPVQTPGCVQAHGAMLVLRLTDLHILQFSENTHQLLGLDAAVVLPEGMS